MSDPESKSAWVYVRRSASGALTAVSRETLPGCEERRPAEDPEVVAWMQQLNPRKSALVESDLALIRALEDVIDVLIRKDVMRLTDLPDSVQAKLLSRRRLRVSINSLRLLDDDVTL